MPLTVIEPVVASCLWWWAFSKSRWLTCVCDGHWNESWTNIEFISIYILSQIRFSMEGQSFILTLRVEWKSCTTNLYFQQNSYYSPVIEFKFEFYSSYNLWLVSASLKTFDNSCSTSHVSRYPQTKVKFVKNYSFRTHNPCKNWIFFVFSPGLKRGGKYLWKLSKSTGFGI